MLKSFYAMLALSCLVFASACAPKEKYGATRSMPDEGSLAIDSASKISLDEAGVLVVDGKKVFPITLTIVPGPSAKAPNGQPAYAEFAKADIVQVQKRSRRPGGASETPAPAPTTAPSDAKPQSGGARPSTSAPAPSPKLRKPIAPVKLQTTEPTGITKAPRRWFASSRFDHRAHRNMTCTDCHSKLDHLDKVDAIGDEGIKAKLTAFATETKQVLSPGMQWTVYQFSASGDKQNVTETSKSCTDCHRADTKAQRFTTTACVSCHAYHDHSQERYADGRPPLAAPVEAPAEEAPTEATQVPSAETPPEPAPALPAEVAPSPETPAPPIESPAPEEVKRAEPATPSEPPDAVPARKSRRPKTSGA